MYYAEGQAAAVLNSQVEIPSRPTQFPTCGNGHHRTPICMQNEGDTQDNFSVITNRMRYLIAFFNVLYFICYFFPVKWILDPLVFTNAYFTVQFGTKIVTIRNRVALEQ